MGALKSVTDWSIEGTGALLALVSLSYVGRTTRPTVTHGAEVLLPLVFAGSIIAFGRWLHYNEGTSFTARQRGLIAIGHLTGAALFSVISGWIIFIVSLESGFPDELLPILLNGAAIGMLTTGGLVAVHVQLHTQQAQLKTQRAQLQERNGRLEKLASIVSHDLRSPLNVAQGRAKLTRETNDISQLETVERALTRMEQIIADMLTLTGQTQTSDEITRIELDKAAGTAWQTVETDDIGLRVEDGLTVDADANSLRQALENLFRNAIDHGGESLTTIRIGALDPAGFYVEDDGVGIAETDRDTVFDWGVTTTANGTGLGLAIVKEISDAHGWHTTVTDSPSDGARFEFTPHTTPDCGETSPSERGQDDTAA